MRGLRINDLKDHHLAFDLRDLLHALGPSALSAWWRPRTPVWYIAEEEASIDALEWREGDAQWTSGSQVLNETQRLRQVVDGVIEGFRTPNKPTGSDKPWVVLRAVDSSWWEIYTDDSGVLSAIRDRFTDVGDALYAANDPATDY
jgi:hypothetical protein